MTFPSILPPSAQWDCRSRVIVHFKSLKSHANGQNYLIVILDPSLRPGIKGSFGARA
jgi:hypothetical protein